jgi:glucoamylase
MIEDSANSGALLPEQLWDCDDIPQRDLFRGKPSGSAMPLVWAHGEYVKLLRSLRDGKVFDLPPQTVERYLKNKQVGVYFPWRFNNKPSTCPRGKMLRVEALAPMRVHWTTDLWATCGDVEGVDTKLGVYTADLPTNGLPIGTLITFTFYWKESDKWEGVDFEVRVS